MSQPILIGKEGNSLREEFGKELVRISKKNKKIIVLDADIAGGTGAHHFRDKFKNRFIQCGIAEQNMISVSAGLSSIGFIPIATTFAIFLIRGIEQVRLSIAYTNLNVKLIGSHVGLDVGPDGASAQCLEDIAIFRSLPNFTILVPSDPIDTKILIKKAIEIKGPVYMRTGRSPSKQYLNSNYKIEIGKPNVISKGKDIVIFACGPLVYQSLLAAKAALKLGISVELVNVNTIKPLNKRFIVNHSKNKLAVITAEDHSILGGLGGTISEILSNLCPKPIYFIGVNDIFGQSGDPEALYEKYNLDYRSIINVIKRAYEKHRK